jgi:hypothetical protein
LRWWEHAAENGLYACTELAKYHEHKLRDRGCRPELDAPRVTGCEPGDAAYMRRHWLDEIDRLAKLEQARYNM